MARETIEYPSTPRPRRLLAVFERPGALRVVAALAVLMVCYVGSYVCLSAFGRFEPSSVDPRGVTGYDWEPVGFTKDYRRHWGVIYFYLPLYVMDCRLWHQYDDAYTGRYPVREPKDIGELYRAW